MKKTRAKPTGAESAQKILARHFRGCASMELVTTSRTFPLTRRVDVQQVVDEQTASGANGRLGKHASGVCRQPAFERGDDRARGLRPALQFALERGVTKEFSAEDIDTALHEMAEAGGTLNRRLLGLAAV